MLTMVYEDESAPRSERYRVLSKDDDQATRWSTIASFRRVETAHTFLSGFTLGYQHGEQS